MDGKSVRVGVEFGNWTVLGKASRKRHWACRCQCGVVKEVFASNLTSGSSKGCRTCMGEKLKTCSTLLKHGHRRGGNRSPTYVTWGSMRSRCLCKGSTSYSYYGGRGIKICKRWDSYENFLADMGERPVGTTLDRKNPDGNYEKSNCRWATRVMQMRNTRRSSAYKSSLVM